MFSFFYFSQWLVVKPECYLSTAFVEHPIGITGEFCCNHPQCFAVHVYLIIFLFLLLSPGGGCSPVSKCARFYRESAPGRLWDPSRPRCRFSCRSKRWPASAHCNRSGSFKKCTNSAIGRGHIGTGCQIRIPSSSCFKQGYERLFGNWLVDEFLWDYYSQIVLVLFILWFKEYKIDKLVFPVLASLFVISQLPTVHDGVLSLSYALGPTVWSVVGFIILSFGPCFTKSPNIMTFGISIRVSLESLCLRRLLSYLCFAQNCLQLWCYQNLDIKRNNKKEKAVFRGLRHTPPTTASSSTSSLAWPTRGSSMCTVPLSCPYRITEVSWGATPSVWTKVLSARQLG